MAASVPFASYAPDFVVVKPGACPGNDALVDQLRRIPFSGFMKAYTPVRKRMRNTLLTITRLKYRVENVHFRPSGSMRICDAHRIRLAQRGWLELADPDERISSLYLSEGWKLQGEHRTLL